MKKRIALLLALFMLFQACSMAEGFTGTICFGSIDNGYEINAVYEKAGGNAELYLDCLPDQVLVLPAQSLYLPALLTISGKSLPQSLKQFLPEALALLPSETRHGSFTGDLLDHADQKTEYDLSWGSLSLILDLVEAEDLPFPDQEEKADLISVLRKNLLKLAKDTPDMRIRMDVFEQERAAALTMSRKEETLLTLSVHSDGKRRRVLLGFADAGKTYYLYADAAFDGKFTREFSFRILADDAGSGYRTLSQRSILLDAKASVRETEFGRHEITAECALGPDQTLFFKADGMLATAPDAPRSLNLNVEYSKEDPEPFLALNVQENKENTAVIPSEAERISLLTADEESIAKLTRRIKDTVNEIRPQVALKLPLRFLLEVIRLSLETEP